MAAKRPILQYALCTVYALSLFICICQVYYYQSLSSKLAERLASLSSWQDMKQCKLPQLDPFNDDVIPYYKDELPPKCEQLFNKNSTSKKVVFKIKDGRFLLKLRNVGCPCCMRSFRRNGDELIKYSKTCVKINKASTKIPRKVEYISVRCACGNVTKYRDAFAIIHPKIAKSQLKMDSDPDLKLNVIILGLDSTSQQNFYRKAPNTRAYLTEVLSAITLHQYNKVGFNTRPNLVALLTGHTVPEMIHTCVQPQINNTEAQLNDCPFIWKWFANRGYLTAFMEDCSLWSMFNYYWKNAFPSSPTDYYYRPLAIHMDRYLKTLNQEEAYCHGPRLSFVSMLNMMKMIVKVATKTNQPFFQFLWSIRQTHGNMNGLGWLDKHMLHLLEHLQESNVLNTTALFILGDHGLHFHGHEFAQTPSGQVEGKMPVGYIVLPQWFQQKYPEAYENLKKNSEKRTSPFDIHATFLDLMNLNKLQMQKIDHKKLGSLRGISLFQNIPEDRTCLEAGIPLQWCRLCYPKIPVSSSISMVQSAANFLVDSINDNSQSYRNACLHLKLKSVDAAWKWDPRDVFSAICHHPRSALNISCDFTDPVEVFQLTLTTSPNNGTYDGEAMRLLDGKWMITENATRIDWYSSQSLCVQEKEVKPYCYCAKKM